MTPSPLETKRKEKGRTVDPRCLKGRTEIQTDTTGAASVDISLLILMMMAESRRASIPGATDHVVTLRRHLSETLREIYRTRTEWALVRFQESGERSTCARTAESAPRTHARTAAHADFCVAITLYAPRLGVETV